MSKTVSTNAPSSCLALRRQRGFTLMEVLVVVAIAAVLMAAFLPRSERATHAEVSQRVVSDVSAIVTQTRVWKGSRPNYTGVSMTELSTMGLVNPDWGQGTGVNPVGGNYGVAANTSNSATMTVTVTELETTLCANVRNQLEPSTVDGSSASCAGGTLTATFR